MDLFSYYLHWWLWIKSSLVILNEITPRNEAKKVFCFNHSFVLWKCQQNMKIVRRPRKKGNELNWITILYYYIITNYNENTKHSIPFEYIGIHFSFNFTLIFKSFQLYFPFLISMNEFKPLMSFGFFCKQKKKQRLIFIMKRFFCNFCCCFTWVRVCAVYVCHL